MFDKEFAELKKVLEAYNKPAIEEKKELTYDEEADEIVRRLATHPTSPIEEMRVMIPMIRHILPSVTAAEILGVQPMTNFEDETKE